ncbi:MULTISPECIES: acyl-CoA dehydrogenase family protein [Amycolatopsis]|uniref:acyl-CoA dehydrogenase family protein n=1 Tax=Amycolatopsis TaxID=1813 RepID=UPI000B8B21AF|nr:MULTISPECIES: acyl-CoA dehydrogenase family protein [Amycolatopsis]OXM73657.1 desulfurization protein [Amycolatopsis sp. KNN50.9b]
MSVTTQNREIPAWPSAPASYDEIVARAKALRPRIAELGVAVDALGVDPTEAMRLLGEAGLQRANVPVEFGGLWTGGTFAGWDRVVEAALEVTAGDGSTGQCWATTALQAREVMSAPLPASTKQAIADELIFQGRRIVASNAETGGTGPVTGRRVDGGVVVNGVKTFNTNSGGGGRDLANVSFRITEPDGATSRHHALIRLDAPGVEAHGDWDNMGQRGTISQTITYAEVFVPDGWHYAAPESEVVFVDLVLPGHALLLQGIGEGAYAAMLEYLRGLNRASMPMFPSAMADPLMHRQIGEMAAKLAAGRAYLLDTCRKLANAGATTDLRALMTEFFKVKVACTTAALDVTARVHDLTGARSTANKYRLDRFWRNARTFASHDSIDAKNAFVGAAELTGEIPDAGRYLPGVRKA